VRSFARVLLVFGLAAVGLFFFRGSPREVTLVYRVPASARELDVDIRRGDATLRRTEFRFPGGPAGPVRHEVRLPDGEYTLGLRLLSEGAAPRVLSQAIAVSEEGTIVVSLPGAP